ncbi:type II toxin-antitoxin system PemK/MazF family toxin [Agathobaculum sp. LCP25S3_E8]|uniref:type II toxin-antitoxin system PemK/MazF family toxin n=1 Tax=Agathobaculum sp. LCP25S3_E8 TaxID=3438735 RepID=UPI003F90D5DB
MENTDFHSVYRGDIFYANLEPVIGSEQGGIRPVLIIQNDIGNRHSPTVIVAAITSRIKCRRLPTHVALDGRQCGLQSESTIMLEQLRTLDKQRLLAYVGSVGRRKMNEVDKALEISVGTAKKMLHL